MTVYYCILLVLTAVGSSAMTYIAPKMLTRIKRLFTRKKRFTNDKPYQLLQLEVTSQYHKIQDLEKQIHNLAEVVASRDRHRKHNIRRDVREYLKEMADGKYDE